MSVLIEGREQMAMFGLLQLRGRLHLEIKGMGFRGVTTLQVLRARGIYEGRDRWKALQVLNMVIAEANGPADRLALATQRYLADQGKKHAVEPAYGARGLRVPCCLLKA